MNGEQLFEKHGTRFLVYLLSKFHYVGSRSVLEDSEPELVKNSDLDFMISESDFQKQFPWMVENGFVLKSIDTHYMDEHTVSVWKYVPKFDKDNMVATADYDHSGEIQITVKLDASYDKLKVMWATFRAHPPLFRDYFWKSNPKAPIDQETVKHRIEQFLMMLG